MMGRHRVKLLHSIWVAEGEVLKPGKTYSAYKINSYWLIVTPTGRSVTVDESSIEIFDEDWIYMTIFFVMGIMLLLETIYLVYKVAL